MRMFEAWAERKNFAQANKFSFLKKLLQQFWKIGHASCFGPALFFLSYWHETPLRRFLEKLVLSQLVEKLPTSKEPAGSYPFPQQTTNEMHPEPDYSRAYSQFLLLKKR